MEACCRQQRVERTPTASRARVICCNGPFTDDRSVRAIMQHLAMTTLKQQRAVVNYYERRKSQCACQLEITN
jgi:hypothetical protein